MKQSKNCCLYVIADSDFSSFSPYSGHIVSVQSSIMSCLSSNSSSARVFPKDVPVFLCQHPFCLLNLPRVDNLKTKNTEQLFQKFGQKFEQGCRQIHSAQWMQWLPIPCNKMLVSRYDSMFPKETVTWNK